MAHPPPSPPDFGVVDPPQRPNWRFWRPPVVTPKAKPKRMPRWLALFLRAHIGASLGSHEQMNGQVANGRVTGGSAAVTVVRRFSQSGHMRTSQFSDVNS